MLYRAVPLAISCSAIVSWEHTTTRDTDGYSALGDWRGSVDVDVFSKEIIKRSLIYI